MTFPLAFIMGFAVASLPGPILVLIASETLRKGPVSGILTLTAPLLVDALVILPAVLFLQVPLVQGSGWGVLGLIGAALLVWLGLQSMGGNGEQTGGGPKPTKPTWAWRRREIHSFLKGILAHLTNPYPYIYWGTVGVIFVRQGMEEGGVPSALLFPLGFWSGAGTLNLLVVFVSARGRQLLSPRWVPYLHRFSGIVLIGCAMLIGIKAWIGLF